MNDKVVHFLTLNLCCITSSRFICSLNFTLVYPFDRLDRLNGLKFDVRPSSQSLVNSFSCRERANESDHQFFALKTIFVIIWDLCEPFRLIFPKTFSRCSFFHSNTKNFDRKRFVLGNLRRLKCFITSTKYLTHYYQVE